MINYVSTINKIFKCKTCEEIHSLSDRNDCNNNCLDSEQQCRDECDLFDYDCLEGCLKIVYGCCMKNCPCADDSSVQCETDDIHFNVSTSWPALTGFKKYLEKPAHEVFNDTSFLPPGLSDQKVKTT